VLTGEDDMPRVIVVGRTGLDADTAYDRICDFPRYPQLTEAVRDVVITETDDDGGLVSAWTVRFRDGLLRWTERDVFRPLARTIVFTQLKGDFATFEGEWSVEPEGTGCRVTFDSVFDLGIPTLAAIIDPIAESTLRGNVLMILGGLLGEVTEETSAADPVGSGHA